MHQHGGAAYHVIKNNRFLDLYENRRDRVDDIERKSVKEREREKKREREVPQRGRGAQ